MLHSVASSPSSSSVVLVGTCPKFLDQWRSIAFNKFVLSMVRGHHVRLRCHPLVFCNFKQFNIRTAVALHPFIHNKVDELLAKGATESSTCGAEFYSNVFVVPKHTGCLQPILHLK